MLEIASELQRYYYFSAMCSYVLQLEKSFQAVKTKLPKTTVSQLKCGVSWLKSLLWPLFFCFCFLESCHHLQACSTEFRHVSPTQILWVGPLSEWFVKALILSSQLWMLEASKMSGGGLIILWHLKL